MSDAVVVKGVYKRFRRYSTREHRTLKETLTKGAFLRRLPAHERYFDALKDVTFSVTKGTTLGIVGSNGSGKSSLLKLLAGIYRPDAGYVRVDGRIAALLNLGVGFHPELTGRENVKISGLVLGLTPQQVREKFDEIVDFAEVEQFIDAPVRTYSSGMYMRLAFSVAVNVDPDVLLIDEVLAVGDAAFTAKCHARMDEFKRGGKTIMLVTHDIQMVKGWCDQAMWIEKGVVRAFGDPAQVIDSYQPQPNVEQVISAEALV